MDPGTVNKIIDLMHSAAGQVGPHVDFTEHVEKLIRVEVTKEDKAEEKEAELIDTIGSLIDMVGDTDEKTTKELKEVLQLIHQSNVYLSSTTTASLMEKLNDLSAGLYATEDAKRALYKLILAMFKDNAGLHSPEHLADVKRARLARAE